MMKRLIIICEGQTEQSFCKDVIAPHLKNINNIEVVASLPKKSHGGIIKWVELKKDIWKYLNSENKNTYVTTFIDYYGLHLNLDYPKNRKSQNVSETRTIVFEIEEAMREEIDSNFSYRFIPYIQLHEFESLIFSKSDVLEKSFSVQDIKDLNYWKETLRQQPDPELINDGVQTAPSKRLKRIVPIYEKITDGTLLTLEIGIEYLKEHCKNFGIWINKLENI